MKQPDLETMVALADGISDGLLLLRVEDDNIDNIRLVFANKQSGVDSSHVFPDHIGQTIREIYNEPMESRDFARAWMRVATTGVSEAMVVEYNKVVYNVRLYSLGNNYVATQYQNITSTTHLQNKLTRIQDQIDNLISAMQ